MSILTDSQWLTLQALIGGIITPVNPKCISPVIDRESSDFIAQVSPADLKNFRKHMTFLFEKLDEQSSRDLKLVLSILSFRPTALLLTRSTQPLTSMKPQQVTAIVTRWLNSSIPLIGKLGRSLRIASVQLLAYDPAVLKAIGYDDPHPDLAVLTKSRIWKPSIIDTADTYDVVIVGSGSSGGVVARRLARAGWRVLIVEKGQFVGPEDIPSDFPEANGKAYESGAVLFSHDVSTTVVAGSTFGGGAAVNWSCSLQPPEFIRNEFSELGAPMFSSPEYSEALESIGDVMKVTNDVGQPHSFTNQLILDSAQKLKFPVSVTGQNTGGHLPNSHFLGYGYRHGEKGGVVNWLKDACDAGAQVVTDTEVLRILYNGEKVHGVELAMKGSEHARTIRCKRVAVCAGALHSPLLLKRSGFSNENIGRYLRLHPVTLVYGEFDAKVNKRTDPIMTAVCTQSDNLDGLHHGPKIEAVHHLPFLHFVFLPWRNSPEDLKALVARYQYLSALLVITRDREYGNVVYNPAEPNRPFIQYSPSGYDRWALRQGSLVAADLHYIGGSRCIVMSNSHIPSFEPTLPREKRTLSDADYALWRDKAAKTIFDKHNTAFGSAHQMGTCRMNAEGPAKGVVDARGRLWECPGIYVADNSIFPAASGVNPMITCMAAAHVIAGKIERDLGRTKL